MTAITLAQKRQIGRTVREHYSGRNARDVRFDGSSITVRVDSMPNTNKPGRIFVGYAAYWLKVVKNEH